MPYLSASAVVIHYEEALYQVYAPLPLPYLKVSYDPVKPDRVLLEADTAINSPLMTSSGSRQIIFVADLN